MGTPTGVVASGGKLLPQDMHWSESKYKLEAENRAEHRRKSTVAWVFATANPAGFPLGKAELSP